MLERLHLLGQQEDARRRTEGPPRLVGLVLMGWGGLVVLAGLVTILAGSHYRGIGGYYLLGACCAQWQASCCGITAAWLFTCMQLHRR